MNSLRNLKERNEHVVAISVDPPFLSIPQGGFAAAVATLYSFDHPAKVSVRLEGAFQPPKPDPIPVLAPLPPSATTTLTQQASMPATATTPTPIPLISLESNPEEVTLTNTGQAEAVLTMRVDLRVTPGIYIFNLNPEVSAELRKQPAGGGSTIYGRTITIKVKAAE